MSALDGVSAGGFTGATSTSFSAVHEVAIRRVLDEIHMSTGQFISPRLLHLAFARLASKYDEREALVEALLTSMCDEAALKLFREDKRNFVDCYTQAVSEMRVQKSDKQFSPAEMHQVKAEVMAYINSSGKTDRLIQECQSRFANAGDKFVPALFLNDVLSGSRSFCNLFESLICTAAGNTGDLSRHVEEVFLSDEISIVQMLLVELDVFSLDQIASQLL